MIAVISDSQSSFNDFIKPWVEKEDQRSFLWVKDIRDVRGIKFTDVIRIGSYWKLKDIDQIYAEAMIQKSKYNP
jgi:hypothetical protein